jgi:hypothetical protein
VARAIAALVIAVPAVIVGLKNWNGKSPSCSGKLASCAAHADRAAVRKDSVRRCATLAVRKIAVPKLAAAQVDRRHVRTSAHRLATSTVALVVLVRAVPEALVHVLKVVALMANGAALKVAVQVSEVQDSVVHVLAAQDSVVQDSAVHAPAVKAVAQMVADLMVIGVVPKVVVLMVIDVVPKGVVLIVIDVVLIVIDVVLKVVVLMVIDVVQKVADLMVIDAVLKVAVLAATVVRLRDVVVTTT